MGAPGGRKYPPGVQDVGSSLLRAPKLVLTDAERARLDESPDAGLYAAPRTMQHVEPQFIAALTGVYSALLPPGGAVLELCASRHSHLPPGLALSRVAGQGMNSQELAGNTALGEWWVQDLNAQPLLLEQLDASYDAVLCVNGLQYLTQPELVLTEAWRVLRPGGLLLVAFGAHFWPEKALAGWAARDMDQRTQLVAAILQANGFDQVQVLDSVAAAAAAAAAITDDATSAAGSQQRSAASAAAPPAADTVSAQMSSPAAAADGASTEVEIRIVLATKGPATPSTPSSAWQPAGAAAAPDAAPDMRPENVTQWFTTPGLAGLAGVAAAPAAAAAAAASGTRSEQQQQQQQQQQQADVSAAFSDERLLQQWVGSYEVLVGDAAELGIPRSVIPQLGPQPTPGEVQAAVAHLQAMVASFLSAGL
uniref:Methyltransferase type 11 domain-containing protein n=1 Tax=Tetradesmus obliquus TaxID=3088 RepID=A0A383VHU0_TETOB|eukprot:jgi/Sobl393_1/18559/SZX64234.1